MESIDGGDQVESLKLKNKKTGEEQTLPVDGIFIAVGISPNSEAFKGLVEMDAGGYISGWGSMERLPRREFFARR